MTYVISDLHGYNPIYLSRLLEMGELDFERDELYILGDLCDRGAYGIELLSWASGIDTAEVFEDFLKRSGIIAREQGGEYSVRDKEKYDSVKRLLSLSSDRIKFILGNHEDMLLGCERLLVEINDESCDELTPGDFKAYSQWRRNGADSTIDGIIRLQRAKMSDTVYKICDFLREAPLYRTASIDGREYVFAHAGLGDFREDKPLDAYTPYQLFWQRPSGETKYFSDKTVVFGHTPTVFFGNFWEGKGEILEGDGWICIDAGVACGYGAALLRLNDMAVFYGEPSGI